MDVTGGRRSPEKNHLKKKKIRFTIQETDIFVCFSQTTSPLNDDDKLRAFHARSAFNSARCGVEVADLLKAALLNKVEQWVNPSTGEDYTPLRYHNNNTCIVLSSGAVGGNREYLRSFLIRYGVFLRIDQRMTRISSHERASTDMISWFQRECFFYWCRRVCCRFNFYCLVKKPDEKAEEREVVDLTWLSRWGIRGRWLELPKAPESRLSWLLWVEAGRWLEIENVEKQGEVQPGSVHPHIQDERDHPVFTRCALWQQRPADVVGFPRLLHGHFLWGSLHNPPVENSQIPVDCVLPL